MSNRTGRRRVRARHGGSGHSPASLESTYFGAPSERAAIHPHHERKDLQLCRQVREQLDLVVAELGDPTLEAVSIAEVTPLGDAHLLRVVVVAPPDADVAAVQRRLELARPGLRAEIAAAIHRKRTPQLTFVVLTSSLLRDEEAGGDDDGP